MQSHRRGPHAAARPARCRWSRQLSAVPSRPSSPFCAAPSVRSGLCPEAPAGPGDDCSCHRRESRRSRSRGHLSRGSEWRPGSRAISGAVRGPLPAAVPGVRGEVSVGSGRPRRHLSPTSCEPVMHTSPQDEQVGTNRGQQRPTCLT